MTFLPQTDSELFELSVGFAPTGAMNEARMKHAAVLLDDGRVLLTGGRSLGVDPVATTELFHP